MRKDIKDYIESEIRFFHDTKKEYEFLKDDLISTKNIETDKIGGGNTNSVSNPTQRSAIKLLTNKRLRRMEESINAINKTLKGLDEIEMEFVELWYWNDKYTMKGIEAKLPCSERTLYRMRDKICESIAIKLGLVD